MGSLKVIKGGTLIDGTGAGPVRDSVVVIEGSKITEVGSSNRVRIPGGAEVIEAGGRVVMPGLIDCHTHISNFRTPYPATGWGTLEVGVSDRAVKAVVAAKNLLEAGITTIRDCGSAGHIDIAVRDAIKRGEIIGPRVLGSDAGLSITGGHGDSVKTVRVLAFEGGKEEAKRHGIVDGVTECIRAVREMVRVGADWIKIWATGGVMEAEEKAGNWEFSDEEIKAIVKEATKCGRSVAAHAVGPTDAIKFCAEVGIKSIEHGIFCDQETIDVMKEKGTFLVPTMIAYELLTKDMFPATTREVAKRAVATHEQTLKMAKKAGVKIAMGTDSGSPYGNVHGKCQLWELELMATRGLTPMEAIVASTKTAAECIGIGGKTGTIEPGKLADLLIVQGSPLEDIKILQDQSRIKMVMREGAPYVTRP